MENHIKTKAEAEAFLARKVAVKQHGYGKRGQYEYVGPSFAELYRIAKLAGH